VTGQRVSTATYQFTPTYDLQLDKKAVFGVRAIDNGHPAHRGYRGAERRLTFNRGQASMASGFAFSKEYKSEPEFKLISVTVHGPNERQVSFQGTPLEADAADGTKYYMIPNGDE
jgi:hypothetical protein